MALPSIEGILIGSFGGFSLEWLCTSHESTCFFQNLSSLCSSSSFSFFIFFISMLFLAVPHFLCFMLNTLSTPFLFSMGKSAHVLRRSCPINRSYLKARKKINFLYIGGKWTATRVYSFHQVGGINKRLNSVAYVGIRLEYLCWPSDYYKLEEIAENSFSCLF